jgi:hypothetical protein
MLAQADGPAEPVGIRCDQDTPFPGGQEFARPQAEAPEVPLLLSGLLGLSCHAHNSSGFRLYQ